MFGGSSNSSSTSVFGGNSSSTSVFGGNNTTVFGNNASSVSVFGGSSQTKSVFGNTASPIQPSKGGFGSTPNTGSFGSVFGGSNSAALTPSKFGTPNVHAAGQTQSVFGSSSNTGQGTNLFKSATSTTGSVFGGSANFGPTPQTQSVFGAQQVTQNQSVFGADSGTQQTFGGSFGSSTANTSSVFVSSAHNATGTSANETSTSVFGQNTQNVFGNAASTNNQTNIPTAPTSVFGQSSAGSLFGKQNGASVFGNSRTNVPTDTDVNDIYISAYTLLTEITDAEKAAFLSDSFEIGKIPMRPPPKELCFWKFGISMFLISFPKILKKYFLGTGSVWSVMYKWQHGHCHSN